jgi:hypothetical protein
MIIQVGTLRVGLVKSLRPARIDPASQTVDRFERLEGSVRSGRAAVEIYRSVGYRALLGGTASKRSDHQIELQVFDSGQHFSGEQRIVGELGHELFVGLPKEYVVGVLDGLLSSPLGPSTVTIDQAAFDEVDSSIAAFRLAGLSLGLAMSSAGGTGSFSSELEVLLKEHDQRPTYR